ncbi:response regulator transcription factor [Mucilaginibacter celer]|uniref:Response regulator n=1 Tax=Mucilaginibacter celer TaxID=2305508 RepID=A0A494VPJ2_9SPHI|nr:response regulator transcription factor [Mucilaginibacter celer]AYL96199.1 response regulator [Mucilaginibacter celer]
MTAGKLSVIIADDHTLFINGLCMLLQSEPDIEIMNVASNGKEVLQLLHSNRIPDLVLLDINMPGINGFEVLKRIRAYYGKVKVVMLSTYNEEHLIEKARTEGANGYLFKNAEKDELIRVMRKVNEGELCFPHKKEAVHSGFDEPDLFLKQFQLTKREMELLQLIKQNLTNQQMADQLHLSIYTVETHRKNIMQKLNLKNPVELNRFIMQNNL